MRLRLGRSWKATALAAAAVGLLGVAQFATGWLATAGAAGCFGCVIALWLVVTIRRDPDMLDVPPGGHVATQSSDFGDGDGAAADGDDCA